MAPLATSFAGLLWLVFACFSGLICSVRYHAIAMMIITVNFVGKLETKWVKPRVF